VPTTEPTSVPTGAPTTEPTSVPTGAPTTEPTTAPTVAPTKDPSEKSDFGGFIERLYVIALDRDSDEGGKAYWLDKVEKGELTGADCALGFLVVTNEFSNRGLSDSDFLEVLYETFFGRPSDEGGKTYWLSQLEGGMTRDNVIRCFIDSKEWCNICASYGIKSGALTAKATVPSENALGFATRLYTKCLGREPEAKGLEYWSLALTNLEKTGYEAASQFFGSTEFKGFNTDDKTYVTRLYYTFMDRDPDEGGMTYWLSELAGGESRERVLARFAGCPEFKAICQKYNIKCGI
jgi:hypothetical protein